MGYTILMTIQCLQDTNYTADIAVLGRDDKQSATTINNSLYHLTAIVLHWSHHTDLVPGPLYYPALLSSLSDYVPSLHWRSDLLLNTHNYLVIF